MTACKLRFAWWVWLCLLSHILPLLCSGAAFSKGGGIASTETLVIGAVCSAAAFCAIAIIVARTVVVCQDVAQRKSTALGAQVAYLHETEPRFNATNRQTPNRAEVCGRADVGDKAVSGTEPRVGTSVDKALLFDADVEVGITCSVKK